MLEDVIAKLRALQATAESHSNNAVNMFSMLVPQIEDAILDSLISEAKDAMSKIPEYNAPAASPLRQRLIQNLSTKIGNRPVHVTVHSDGRVNIFDEDFAGTEDDFEDARHESSKPQPLRYRFWKYGIYKPSVEGDISESDQAWFKRASEKLPSYEQIIQERLAIWGDKAPYWYFIEYGNFGAGKAYPQFGGTFFITRFRQEAQQAVRFFLEELARTASEEAVQSMDTSISTSRHQRPVPPRATFQKAIRRASNLFNRIFKRQ